MPGDKEALKNPIVEEGITYLERCVADGVFRMTKQEDILSYFRNDRGKVSDLYIIPVLNLALDWWKIRYE